VLGIGTALLSCKGLFAGMGEGVTFLFVTITKTD
jgi:hypothetical protein